MAAKPIRVMVVDDTPHVLRMLTSMLSIDGFDVVSEATSGAEAVERLEEADPDVVVIDYKMPVMDGLTAARELRSRRPHQVVVLYTAYIDDALEREAAEVGVALCLDKIEGLASLEREISRLCTSLT
ncbi:MAG TPA: response regulator [Acidimicrobiales bacterium]|nr:response regulator [Acidimicrobiales bacterium]